MAEKGNMFQRLTSLFRAGPVVKRRVRTQGSGGTSSAAALFKRAHNDVYNTTLSAYGSFDRMSRYSDFSEMESTPEIASALDIYGEETVSPDEHGRVLHIFCENDVQKELLETLFYDTLNIEFNLVMWVRNLCKYGDFFLFNDIDPEFGVINAYPIPISEVEREEGFDPENPGAVRFRWLTQGNTTLENWQLTHFRLLGNDAFLPYGSSVLESARRIWRQLILIEDAMLVYRVIRSPERRVFYIDVGNVPPEDVPNYLEQATSSLKRAPVIDKTNGKVDLRFNPLSVDEDYFIPVRGGESGTKIESLAGGANTSAIEDVEYIQKKLFAALKIPKAYLGYDEDIGAKATLAQEDIRFSRTIQRIQKTVVAELNKLAMIHLFVHGYDGEDLIDFELKLSNPSSVAQLQKLELISTRFDIAGKVPEGFYDRRWVQKNVLGLTDKVIEEIIEGRKEDKIIDAEVEASGAAEGGEEAGGGGFDMGGGEEAGGDDEGGGLFAADEPEGPLLTAYPSDKKSPRDPGEEDEEEEIDISALSIDDPDAPLKAQASVKKVFGKPTPGTQANRGPLATHMPDFKKMVTHGRPQDSLRKPYGEDYLKPAFEGIEWNEQDTYESMSRTVKPTMTPELKRAMRSLSSILAPEGGVLLSEAAENEEDSFDLDEYDAGEIDES
jgi:hypothetical protein